MKLTANGTEDALRAAMKTTLRSCLHFCSLGLLLGLLGGCGSSGSDSAESQDCTSNCIEADLKMPDGSRQHIRRVAVAGSVVGPHRVAIGTVQDDGEVGITLAFDSTKVTLGEAMPTSERISDGVEVWIHGAATNTLIGIAGEFVFQALSESTIDGTFNGIIAKASDVSTDVIEVTNGVFHATR